MIRMAESSMNCPFCGSNREYTRNTLYTHIFSFHKKDPYARILAMAIRLGDEEARKLQMAGADVNVKTTSCVHIWKAETFHDGSVSVKCTQCNDTLTIGGSMIRIYHRDGTLRVDTIDLRTFGL